jgi:hypothetical protein
LITKVNDKAMTPTTDNTKAIGEEFNTFAKQVPTLSPELQFKLFQAHKSGKWVIEKDDNMTRPDELTNINTQS